MLTRPRAPGHSRFLSQLNDGFTHSNAYQNSFFETGQILAESWAKMADPPRLVLEAYGKLGLELKQYVKWRPGTTLWMAWLIFATLPSILYNVALRVRVPNCLFAHALIRKH